jgi:hypothetical protein
VKVEVPLPVFVESNIKVNDPLAFWKSPVPPLMVAVPLASAPVLVTEMLSPEYVALMESPLLNVMVREPAIVPVLVVTGGDGAGSAESSVVEGGYGASARVRVSKAAA